MRNRSMTWLCIIICFILFVMPASGAFIKPRDCPADAKERPLNGSKLIVESVFVEECVEDPCVLYQRSNITLTVKCTFLYKASRIRNFVTIRTSHLYTPLTYEEDNDLCEYTVEGPCKNIDIGSKTVVRRKIQLPPLAVVQIEAQSRLFLKDDKGDIQYCGDFGVTVKDKPFDLGMVLAPTSPPGFGFPG